jgi:hypothetical protein
MQTLVLRTTGQQSAPGLDQNIRRAFHEKFYGPSSWSDDEFVDETEKMPIKNCTLVGECMVTNSVGWQYLTEVTPRKIFVLR